MAFFSRCSYICKNKYADKGMLFFQVEGVVTDAPHRMWMERPAEGIL